MSMRNLNFPSKSLNSLLLGCFLLSMAATAVYGQSQASTGQIVGIILDQSGAAVPGAQITVTNPSTGLKRVLVSNDEGQYRAVLLPPGKYDVAVELSGFQKATRTGVEVNVGKTVDNNFTLQVGSISQVVEVTGAPLIESTRPEFGTLVNETAIDNLPINGRRFHDFVSLTPTVQVDPSRGQLSFVGQRGINSNINIDGADYNEPFFGGIRGGERSNSAFTIPQEAIGEFEVVTRGYSAEFGRSSGGVVNAVTKSGQNELHGSAFYLLRHKELATKNALDQFSLSRQQQFGGSIGGPIVKDKAFYFGAFERQVVRNPRQVSYTRLVGITKTPANGEAYDLYKSLEVPFTQTNDVNSFLVRVDHQVSEGNRFSVRYNFADNNAENAVATGEAISPLTNRALSTNGTEGDRTQSVNGQFTSIFRPTVVNELRAQYSRENRPREANSQIPNVATTIGEFGTRTFLPTTLTDYRIQISDGLNWSVGTHNVKFGTEYNHIFVDQLFAFNQFGAFIVSGSNVDQALQILSLTPGDTKDNRFASTAVSYNKQFGNGLVEFRQNILALFFQDNWRARKGLTLNMGFRWEANFNPSPESNNTALTDAVRNTAFPIGRRLDPSKINDQFKQFLPRVGLAWDVWGDGKSVFRANWGVFTANTPLLLYAGPMNNFRTPPGDVSIQLPLTVPAGNPNNTVYKQLLLLGVDLNKSPLDKLAIVSPQDLVRLSQLLGLTFDPNRGLGPIAVEDGYRNPRSYNWGLGIEHQLARGLTAGISYDHVKTVKLQRNRDYNLPASRIRPTDKSLRPFFGLRSGTQRPIASLGSVQARESSAKSLYRGGTIRVQFQRPRYQLQAFYTLAWNYSDDDNERDAGGTGYENSFNLGPEYSFARIDVRHQFLVNGVVNIPWGFVTSSILRMQSGRPIDPSAGTDANEDRGGPDRPYAAPGVPFRRNSFRNMATATVDLRVLKGINLWNETSKLQFSVEFFNLFNNDNVTFSGTNSLYGLGIDPATGNVLAPNPIFRRLRLANGKYDTSNVPGAPFQAQVGLRLMF